mgnify:CR=1 FL=1
MITNDLLNFKIKHKDGTITYQPFLSEQDVKDFNPIHGEPRLKKPRLNLQNTVSLLGRDT